MILCDIMIDKESVKKVIDDKFNKLENKINILKITQEEGEIYLTDELISVINWISHHIRSQSGIKPSEKILEIFKKYNWMYNDYAYRGIHWGSYYKPFTSPYGDFKMYENVKELNKELSSWTKSKEIAASFAAIGAHDRWIISDNKYFPTLKQRVCNKVKIYGGAGIIIKTNISDGLDIQKAIYELENVGGRISSYLDKKLPSLYESEVLVLNQIHGKIIEHYHEKLCD